MIICRSQDIVKSFGYSRADKKLNTYLNAELFPQYATFSGELPGFVEINKF